MRAFAGALGAACLSVFQNRQAVYGFLAGFLLWGAVAGIFTLLGLRLRSRREELVMKYQQEMLKLVRDLAFGPGFVAGERLGTGRPASAVRPERLEPGAAVPACFEVTPEDAADPVFQLIRVVFSGSLKERALAAIHLLKLDAGRALKIIRQLIQSEDPFQRESMALALGEGYHPQSLELLAGALQDSERRVALASFRSLVRLLHLPANEMASEARGRVKTLLREAPSSLRNYVRGWDAL